MNKLRHKMVDMMEKLLMTETSEEVIKQMFDYSFSHSFEKHFDKALKQVKRRLEYKNKQRQQAKNNK